MKKDETFAGFEPSNTTPVPDILFDQLMTQLNDRELRAMLYIIRRTLGFKKTADVISYNQFVDGIKKLDGTQLDNGCGITSPNALSKALKSLEEKGLIISEKRRCANKALLPTLYRVRFKAEEQATPTTKSVVPPTTKTIVGYGQNDSSPTTKSVDTLLSKQYRQETVLQDTDSQETVRQEESSTPASLTEYKHRKETDPALPVVKPSKQTPPPQSQVKGTPDVQAPSASVGTGTAQTGAPAQKKVTQAHAIQQVPKCSTKEIQARINAYRGYALEEEVEIIRERKAIKTWCNLHELADYDLVLHYLTTLDPYWRKPENKFRIGGLTLLKETPKALAEIAKRQNGKSPETLGNYHYYRPQAAGGGR